MFRHSFKIPLLYIVNLVNCIEFYNPPNDPIVFKIVENNNKLFFQKLHNKNVRDLVTELNNPDMEAQNAILNEPKQYKMNYQYHKGHNNDVKLRNPIKNVLKQYRNDKLKDMKKVFVKRVVPHGYKSESLEYDSNFNSYFKPLVRFHKGVQDLGINRLKDENLEVDDILLQPFKLEAKANKYQRLQKTREDINNLKKDVVGLVKEIEHLLKDVKSPGLRWKTYNTIRNVLKDVETLRTNPIIDNMASSGEENHVPGKKQIQEPAEEEDKPVVFDKPYHPMYQYWTYTKNIHQDQCPGDMIKIGNVCSWVPPH